MPDNRKYVIEIYHNGVVMQARIRGIDRYLQEKAFLAELFGQGPPEAFPDFYPLTDEQLAKYGAFRKKLNKK